MFEKALRLKLRFATSKGSLSVEDLWDLSLEALNTIYKSLKKQLNVASEESLLEVKTSQDERLELSIEIVKHIFTVKSAEANARVRAREIADRKRQLLDLIAQKEEQALGAKSIEDLKAELLALQ